MQLYNNSNGILAVMMFREREEKVSLTQSTQMAKNGSIYNCQCMKNMIY